MAGGWNDHLPDPDGWEPHLDAMLVRADLERKRARENPEPPAAEDVPDVRL